MEQRNFDPLMILGVTGVFLLLLAGVMHVFPGKQPVQAATKSIPVTAPAIPIQSPDKPDSLQAILSDRDSITSMFTGLDPFFQSVRQVQTGNTLLHIAYFGDSMIEGDLVTQSLRRYLQQRFGGDGVGFVPVTTPLPGFRTTIRQSFNDHWNICSFGHTGNSGGESPGISGYAYISNPGAEVKFESGKGYGPFHQAEIIYGGKNNIILEVLTGHESKVLSLAPINAVSSFTVTPDSAFPVFELRVRSAEPGIVYGVNFENGPGVYVDNYAFRGNSGMPMTTIPVEIFAGFNATLHNELLILHFGLNVFTPGVEDYHWYEMAMRQVIRHIKQSSPGVSILMISMTDRSTLISGEYHTPSGLPEFIRLQQRVAAKEQIAFFNLYEAMGGANSMKRWVEGHPMLAGYDYTHPNGAGAAKIALLVYDFLMKGYDRYLQKSDSTSTANFSAPSI